MATNGADAAAAGMQVLAGTEDIREVYDEVNLSRDYLARHETSGGHPLDNMDGTLPINKGGTGAVDAQTARDNLRVVENSNGSGNRIRLKWTGSALQLTIDNTVIGTIATGVDLSNVQQKNTDYQAGPGVLISTGGRGSTVTSGYVAAYFNGDGTLRCSPSARRFKDDITPLDLTDQEAAALLSLRTVRYNLKENENADHAHPDQIGWIAEELIAAGFPELVPRVVDPDAPDYGLPFTIDYSRAVTLLLSLIQWQNSKINDLDARLTELETKNG